MRCVPLLTLLLLIAQPFTLHAEDADEAREKGIAALKDSQTNPHAIVEAARFFVKAAALYGDAGNEEKNVEMNSFLYWCKKKMTLEDIEQFTKGGEAAVTSKLAAVEKAAPKADEAQKWFDRAEQFAKKNPDEHLLIAIRFYEVADRFKGSDAGLAALDRSLKEQLSDKNSTVKTVPQPTTIKPTETVANDIAKRPVPLADDLKTAEKLIKDLLKADYAKTDAPSRLALIAKLLQQAEENKNDAASYYVLLHEARDQAVLAGDCAKAAEAQHQLRDSFKMDFAAILIDLRKLEPSAKTAEPAAALATLFSLSADDALAVENYDQAVRFNSHADDLLPFVKDAALKSRLKAEIPRVQAIKRESVAALAAQKTLATKPDDAEANLTAGKFALLLGDFEKSMAMLAKSKDAALSGLAKRELAPPQLAAEQALLADGWFDRAEKDATVILKTRMQERAALWYTSALPGLVGLAKLKVEGRMKALPQAGANTAVAQGSKSAEAPKSHAENFAGKKDVSLDLGGGIKLDLVLIPAGTFEMGSPANEAERDGNERQFTVTISKPYYMGKYDVTQEQYKAVTGENPSEHKSNPKNPVDNVTWEDAQTFCNKLGQRIGRKANLPTEAQWEYACRAGTTTPFYFGENITAAQANYNGQAPYHGGAKGEFRAKPTPVGSFPPNAFGLYDMHGNVWQWCLDTIAEYPTGPQTDPEGPTNPTQHNIRGGSWANGANDCRSAHRNGTESRHGHVGFRIIMEAGTVADTKTPAAVPPVATPTSVGKELVLDLGNGIKMELLPIPPGTFQMGSPPNERGRSGEERAHQVTITKPFYMGKYPVTQEQYEAIVGSNPSSFKGPKNPVDTVSHSDAQSFCEKVNEQPQVKAKLPAGFLVQLSTEAQWEYACRAGTKTSYYSGDTDADLDNFAWFNLNGEHKTHPVGEKKPNAWGLYDMNGNVFCWCRDWMAPYPAGAQIDPQGPEKGNQYAIRSGSWYWESSWCRSAHRNQGESSLKGPDFGFRVVVSSAKAK